MLSMNLYLFCPDGYIRSIWLPRNVEGRYHFDSQTGHQDLPFYVEASDNTWNMFCGESGSFFVLDVTLGRLTSIGSVLPLRDRAFSYLSFQGRNYATYSESEKQGDRVFIPYYFEPISVEYTIGRNQESLIEYRRSEVSRQHASILWNGKSCETTRVQTGFMLTENGNQSRAFALEM